MDCKKAEALILKHFEENLSIEEYTKLNKHTAKCSSCRKSFIDMEKLNQIFEQEEMKEVPGSLDDKFYAMLEREKSHISNSNAPKSRHFTGKMLLQIAASLVLLLSVLFTGIYLGGIHNDKTKIAQLENDVHSLKENMVSGLSGNNSPSQRIQAVYYAKNIENADDQLINILFETLNTDENTNVRMAAFEALLKYSANPRVKTGFMNALGNQEDPGVKILIIKFLANQGEEKYLSPLNTIIQNPNENELVKNEALKGIQTLI